MSLPDHMLHDPAKGPFTPTQQEPREPRHREKTRQDRQPVSQRRRVAEWQERLDRGPVTA